MYMYTRVREYTYQPGVHYRYQYSTCTAVTYWYCTGNALARILVVSTARFITFICRGMQYYHIIFFENGDISRSSH